MNCRQLLHTIEFLCPPAHAENWDNPGLIAGDYDKDIKKIYIALDATSEVIDEAIRQNCDLIITHHPLVFSGLRQINSDDFTARRLLKLIRNDICCYAMHTNFDVDVMGDLAADMLGLLETSVLQVTGQKFVAGAYEDIGIGTHGILPEAMTLRDCAELVKTVFDIPDVRIFGDPDQIVRTAAMCPGSGKDLLSDVKRVHADVYISGDFGHHNGLDAVEQGIMVIDAGHQGIEKIFVKYMKDYIEKHIEGVEVMTEDSRPPFLTL